MKRFFVLSLMAMMFVATLTTSCSMQSMTFKNLEKKGYVVGQLSPAQQAQIAPRCARRRRAKCVAPSSMLDTEWSIPAASTK